MPGGYIEEAKQAMEDRKIQFAGKIQQPDYEMLVDQDCDVAIESTMILHTPKVQEMIEDLDIPVYRPLQLRDPSSGKNRMDQAIALC